MTELRVERQRGAAIVSLNRPERSNALSRQTLHALGELGKQLSAEPDLRAVILTGSGERAFCAGADLKERSQMTRAQIKEQLRAYRTELRWLSRSPLPTVAAINGAALGGGLELALLCDFRVCVSHAEFALPETSLGVIPGAGGTQRLPRLIGPARAQEMILLGRRLNAADALAWGLVSRVFAPGQDLLTATLEFLEPVLSGAPLAQRAALQAVRAADELSLEAGLALELKLYEPCLDSQDRSEALRAFAEKRKPVFQGR